MARELEVYAHYFPEKRGWLTKDKGEDILSKAKQLIGGGLDKRWFIIRDGFIAYYRAEKVKPLNGSRREDHTAAEPQKIVPCGRAAERCHTAAEPQKKDYTAADSQKRDHTAAEPQRGHTAALPQRGIIPRQTHLHRAF